MSEHLAPIKPTDHHSDYPTDHTSPRDYFVVFAILMVLLGFTVGVAYLHLGVWSVVLAVAIAVTKAVLVILYFMHARHSSRVIWLFVGMGFVFLGWLILLTMADYLSRGWLRN